MVTVSLINCKHGRAFEEYNIETFEQTKAFKSTCHENYAEQFAYIYVSGEEQISIYLIADSEQNYDMALLSNPNEIVSRNEYHGSVSGQVTSMYDAVRDISLWNQYNFTLDPSTTTKFSVLWYKDGSASSGTDCCLFRTNLPVDEIQYPEFDKFGGFNNLLNSKFSDIKLGNEQVKAIYFGTNELYKYVKPIVPSHLNHLYTDVCGGKWYSESIMGFNESYGITTLENWNTVKDHVFYKDWESILYDPCNQSSQAGSDNVTANIYFQCFYRAGFSGNDSDVESIDPVNVRLTVYDSDGNEYSYVDKPMPHVTDYGVEENNGIYTSNNGVICYPNSMTETGYAFSQGDYTLTFEEVLIPNGGCWTLEFTSINEPAGSWTIWNRDVRQEIYGSWN